MHVRGSDAVTLIIALVKSLGQVSATAAGSLARNCRGDYYSERGIGYRNGSKKRIQHLIYDRYKEAILVSIFRHGRYVIFLLCKISVGAKNKVSPVTRTRNPTFFLGPRCYE